MERMPLAGDVVNFLTARYGAVSEVAELGGGDWSRAFSFRLGAEPLVARFGQYPEDFEKDRAAMEFAGPDLPVPRVLEIGEALGGFYAISERHHGIFLESLDFDGWLALTPSLFHALDAMRAIRPSAGGSVGWDVSSPSETISWHDWLVLSLEDRPGRRVSGWRAELAKEPWIERVYVDAEKYMLSSLRACPELRNLVHSDLLNRNVLVDRSSASLEAVFDWGCAFFGDFVYEIAWFTFWAPWYPALEQLDFEQKAREHFDAIGLAVPAFPERLRCYEAHIGLAHIAYSTFTRRHDDQAAVASRTRRALSTAGA
jgi:aminoglycoside phosphotransferase (APT) family kinase protein